MDTGTCSTEGGKLKHMGPDQRGSLDAAENRWVGTSSSVLCTAPAQLPPFLVLMVFPYVPSGPLGCFQESPWQCPSSRLPLTGRWKAAGSGGCCWQPQPHGQRSIFTAKPPAAWATRGLGWQPFNRGAPWSRTNLGQEVSETFICMVSPLTPSVPHAGQSQPPRTLAYRTGWQDRHSSL